MIRWTELAVASRLSGANTQFGLLFHTEGLINDKISRELESLGKDLRNVFRPLLAVITPLCPQYMIDPTVDRLRIDFAHRETNRSIELDFESKIKKLSEYYDIGYHGHFFFTSKEGRHRANFHERNISRQFDEEYEFLTRLGIKPRVYAGGWWYISPVLVSLMRSRGFQVDTSVNDLLKDSFSRPQPYAYGEIGRPFWLAEGLLEIPSIRSFASLTKIAAKRGGPAKFVAIAMHDYDLLSAPLGRLTRKIARRLSVGSRVLSIPDLAASSRNWLQGRGHKRVR